MKYRSISKSCCGVLQGQDVAFEPAKLLWLIQRDFLRKLFLVTHMNFFVWIIQYLFCPGNAYNLITSHRSDHNHHHYAAYTLDLLVLKMLNLLKNCRVMLDLNSYFGCRNSVDSSNNQLCYCFFSILQKYLFKFISSRSQS
jgi:hypothetical protein